MNVGVGVKAELRAWSLKGAAESGWPRPQQSPAVLRNIIAYIIRSDGGFHVSMLQNEKVVNFLMLVDV